MTTIQVPVDEITARAREVSFARVMLTLIMGLFYVIGWSAGHAWTAVAWLAGHAWTGSVILAFSVRRGWLDARPVVAVPARPGA